MTGADWQRIASAKMFSQHARCGAKACKHKKDKLDTYIYPRPELAHIVPKTKGNRRIYGEAALDHPDNLVLVHEGSYEGVDCNDSVVMDRKANPVAVEEHMARILEKLKGG